MSLEKVIVTGASGFVGSRVMKILDQKYDLVPISLKTTPVEKINFHGVNKIIHLAGIAHVMGEIDPKIYFEVNQHLTVRFANAAKQAGVKHFVFFSTVKVFGLDTSDNVIDESCNENPGDDYGRSKYLAEQSLRELQDPEFKLTIIRPPLIYGPGVKGNVQSLLKLLNGFRFLPLGSINNRRTMVYVDALVKYTGVILEKGHGGIFIPANAKPYSTTELVQLLANMMDKKVYLFGLPGFVVGLLQRLMPRYHQRLFGSLVFNSINSTDEMRLAIEDVQLNGFRKMVDQYKKQ